MMISRILVGMLFAELGNCDPDSAFNLCINSIKDILGYFSLDEIGKFKNQIQI